MGVIGRVTPRIEQRSPKFSITTPYNQILESYTLQTHFQISERQKLKNALSTILSGVPLINC